MKRKVSSKFKQLQFDTAIRNPERYVEILKFIEQYEGVVLTKTKLLEIVSNMYLKGIVSSEKLIIEKESTVETIKDSVISVNESRKADGGYPQGYCSRFWTYMRTLSEFGFVYARYNEKMLIGDIAKKMINREIDEQEAFSVQVLKYNRKSPYKNVSNDYNYFKFILSVLEELANKGEKLSMEKFILSTFNKNGDVLEFIKLLDKNSFKDKEDVYEYIQKNFEGVNKIGTVVNDYPDVVLRILRLTGFIKIEYIGKIYISIDDKHKEYMKKLLNMDFVLDDKEKKDANLYFEKLSKMNSDELEIIKSNRKSEENKKEYNDILKETIKKYELDKNKIIDLLSNITNKKNQDERFKYISDPLKLEWYISMLIYEVWGEEFSIKPNYKIDSIGIPISYAPGNQGDIEVMNDSVYWLIEVTLIRNKMQQLNNETVNLFRHVRGKEKQKKYLSLIAPCIHEDTAFLFKNSIIGYQLENINTDFYAVSCSINEFVNSTIKKENFSEMEKYTNNIMESLKILWSSKD